MRASQIVFLSLTALPLASAGCIIVADGHCTQCGSHTSWGSAHGHSVKGSGVSATETRTVTDFERVEILCGADLTLKVGPAALLTVSGDDNLVPKLKTEVREKALVIEMESGSYSPKVGMKIEATVPALRGIAIKGSSNVHVSDLAGDSFTVAISGSGDAHATGKVEHLDASISGSGDLKLAELEARDARVQISGSGDVEVWATEALTASIAGSGDVRYKGEPKVTKSVAGSGSVAAR